MGGKFKKTVNTSGTIKDIIIHEGSFMSEESGESIDLIEILSSVYGEDNVFNIATSAKTEEEL